MQNDSSITGVNKISSDTTQAVFRSEDPFGDASVEDQQEQSALRVREQRQRFLETSQRRQLTSRLTARSSNLGGTTTNNNNNGNNISPPSSVINSSSGETSSSSQQHRSYQNPNQNIETPQSGTNDVMMNHQSHHHTTASSDDLAQTFNLGSSFAGGGLSLSNTARTQMSASSSLNTARIIAMQQQQINNASTANLQSQGQQQRQKPRPRAPTLSSITSVSDIISINVTGADRVLERDTKKEVIYYNLCTTTSESATHQQRRLENGSSQRFGGGGDDNNSNDRNTNDASNDDENSANVHKPWLMMRRFSEFDSLHAKITQMLKPGTSVSLSLPETALTAFEANCELPSKLTFSGLGKQSDDFVAKRRKQLESYLQSILSFIKWLTSQIGYRENLKNSLLLLLETLVAFLGGPKLISTVRKGRIEESANNKSATAATSGNNSAHQSRGHSQIRSNSRKRGLTSQASGGEHDFVVVGGDYNAKRNNQKFIEDDDVYDEDGFENIGGRGNKNNKFGSPSTNSAKLSSSNSPSPKFGIARNGSMESFAGASSHHHHQLSGVTNNNYNNSRALFTPFIPPYQIWHNPQQHFSCIIGFTSCMIQISTMIDAKSFDGRDVIVYGQSVLTHSLTAENKALNREEQKKNNKKNGGGRGPISRQNTQEQIDDDDNTKRNKSGSTTHDANNNNDSDEDDEDDDENERRAKPESDLTPRSRQAKDLFNAALVDLVEVDETKINKSDDEKEKDHQVAKMAEKVEEASKQRRGRRDSVAVPMKTEISKSSFFVPTRTIVQDRTHNYLFNGLELATENNNKNNNQESQENTSSSVPKMQTGGLSVAANGSNNSTFGNNENTNDILFSFVVEVPPPFEPSYCFIRTSPAGATVIEWPRPKFL